MNSLLNKFDLDKIASYELVSKNYLVHIVDTDALEQEHIAIGRDGRLYHPDFKPHSLSFLIKAKDTGEAVMAFSFFGITWKNADLCRFWSYDNKKENVRNISLTSIIGYVENNILTPGYIVNKVEHALDLVVFYDEVAQEIFKLFDNNVFIEVAGPIELEDALLECGELAFTGEKPVFPKNMLGKINDASRSSFEYALVNDFVEMDTIFNYYTAGKVLFSPQLLARFEKHMDRKSL